MSGRILSRDTLREVVIGTTPVLIGTVCLIALGHFLDNMLFDFALSLKLKEQITIARVEKFDDAHGHFLESTGAYVGHLEQYIRAARTTSDREADTREFIKQEKVNGERVLSAATRLLILSETPCVSGCIESIRTHLFALPQPNLTPSSFRSNASQPQDERLADQSRGKVSQLPPLAGIADTIARIRLINIEIQKAEEMHRAGKLYPADGDGIAPDGTVICFSGGGSEPTTTKGGTG